MEGDDNVGDSYVYPKLSVAQYVDVPKHHMISCKYAELLCIR